MATITTYPYSPTVGYGPLSQGVGTVPGLQIVDEVSTNLARFYTPHGFIYPELVAPQNVVYNVGEYPVFDPASLFANGASNLSVADDAPTPLIDVNYSLDSYQTQDYRLGTKLTRKEMVQAHPALRLDYVKTTNLLNNFALNKEYRLAQLLQCSNNGGKFTQTSPQSPSVLWDAGTSTTPATIQADIQLAILTAYKATGVRPNTLVLDLQVAMAIGNDYTLKDQIKYQIGPRNVAEGWDSVLPPTLFGLRVVIADGTLYNQGRPGDKLSLGSVWGNKARVLYVDPNAQWGQPSVVYALRGRISDGAGDAQPPETILPTDTGGAEPGAPSQSIIVDRWWSMDPPSQHIRVWENVVEKLVAPDLGIEISPVLGTF